VGGVSISGHRFTQKKKPKTGEGKWQREKRANLDLLLGVGNYWDRQPEKKGGGCRGVLEGKLNLRGPKKNPRFFSGSLTNRWVPYWYYSTVIEFSRAEARGGKGG